MSVENQNRVQRFVDREVLVCQTGLVERLFECGVFNYEDVVNLYYKDEDTQEEEPQEIFEWWVVTDFLADKLEKEGEPVLRNDYGIWWGRTCTGQAIMLDDVIWRIYEGLGLGA